MNFSHIYLFISEYYDLISMGESKFPYYYLFYFFYLFTIEFASNELYTYIPTLLVYNTRNLFMGEKKCENTASLSFFCIKEFVSNDLKK